MIRTMLLCGRISPVLAALIPVGMVTELWGGQKAISESRSMAKSTAESRKVRKEMRKSQDTGG